MEIKESVIIGFLLVIIIILIFSNISVTFGSSEDDSSSSGKSGSSPTNKPIPSQPKPTKFDPQNSDLLSNDIKKQLKELDSMYYTNQCKV